MNFLGSRRKRSHFKEVGPDMEATNTVINDPKEFPSATLFLRLSSGQQSSCRRRSKEDFLQEDFHP